MYHIYTAPGIVLDKRPAGEADMSVGILTANLGFVRARAHGIRKLSSKLRFSLQPFTQSTVSFVYGKAGWHIVGALFLHTYRFDSEESMLAAGRIAAAINRLVSGEEANAALYREVAGAFTLLESSPETASASDIETLAMMRILNALGYWGESFVSNYLITGPLEDPQLHSGIRGQKARAGQAINRALRESQL